MSRPRPESPAKRTLKLALEALQSLREATRASEWWKREPNTARLVSAAEAEIVTTLKELP